MFPCCTQTLMEEVSAQQSIIYQTSQALNLIASNPEHKGSLQEVEAERLLLIAAQRRQACLAEIQRLKTTPPARGTDTMQTSDGEVMKACKGFVTLQDLRLPLKTEYVLSSKQGKTSKHLGVSRPFTHLTELPTNFEMDFSVPNFWCLQNVSWFMDFCLFILFFSSIWQLQTILFQNH